MGGAVSRWDPNNSVKVLIETSNRRIGSGPRPGPVSDPRGQGTARLRQQKRPQTSPGTHPTTLHCDPLEAPTASYGHVARSTRLPGRATAPHASRTCSCVRGEERVRQNTGMHAYTHAHACGMHVWDTRACTQAERSAGATPTHACGRQAPSRAAHEHRQVQWKGWALQTPGMHAGRVTFPLRPLTPSSGSGRSNWVGKKSGWKWSHRHGRVGSNGARTKMSSRGAWGGDIWLLRGRTCTYACRGTCVGAFGRSTRRRRAALGASARSSSSTTRWGRGAPRAKLSVAQEGARGTPRHAVHLGGGRRVWAACTLRRRTCKRCAARAWPTDLG